MPFLAGLDGLIPLALKPAIDLITQSRTSAAALVLTGAAVTHGVHWWLDRRNLNSGNFRKRICFEGVSFHENDGPFGPVTVEFDTNGDEYELREVVGYQALEHMMALATRRSKDGVLCLKSGIAHSIMMNILERHVKGNDPIGAMAKIMGRPTNRDPVGIMPTFYAEEDVSIIRVLVVSEHELRGRLQDPKFIKRLVPEYDQYARSVDMVKRMAVETVADTQRHRTTARVRFTKVTTAKVLADAA